MFGQEAKKTEASRGIFHVKPDFIQFSMFSTDEIKKLAVCKIVSSMTFDAMGYPCPGGLYDRRLGPVSSQGDVCQTCAKNLLGCPGHFGYFDLILPVVNPLFHKMVALLMKNVCFHCFHLQIPDYVKYTLPLQMRLLDNGRLVEAMDVEQVMSELMAKYHAMHKIPEDEMQQLRAFGELIGDDGAQMEATKNVEDVRNKIIGGVWKNIKKSRQCNHCKAPLAKVVSIKNKLIVNEKQKLDADDKRNLIVKAHISKPITPQQSREYIRKIWKADQDFLQAIFPVLQNINSTHPTDIFFYDTILVPPCKVRPVNIVAGRMSEHPQTSAYKRVLLDNMLLRAIVFVLQQDERSDILPDESRAAMQAAKGATAMEKMSYAWELLQHDVDLLVDNDGRMSGEQGLKQLIEKKTGIIRMNMMGKRVNFAARSVITPDPCLNVDEIGVPEVFAKHLSYPVPVTMWNVEEMRKLIMNGPNIHPGALSVEFEDGSVIRIKPDCKVQQESLLKRLLTPDGPDKCFRGFKTVNRHLCNGDVLLLNRQPTLHRPSIMAHTARVLKKDKTLRLHYANCKAYNADFDGDEMNAHFPQNEVARSEAYHLANVANQYLSPKDGSPLSGLIQDHMIAGVKMSLRGRFFSRLDYQQLVYQALSSRLSHIRLLPPTVLKPRALWSGKQILSTVILNSIPRGRVAINLTSGTKISARAWQSQTSRKTVFSDDLCMSEAQVIIRNGELLTGVLDKAHYGATPYGLVHCMYELYGGACAIRLLSAFAKLFTSFLQREGFTLGVQDILVSDEADAQRREIVSKVRTIGDDVMRKALNIPEASNAEIVQELNRQSIDNPKLRSIIDRHYKSALDTFTNDVNKTCLPRGLIAQFPNNNLQLMVQSGAKGSTVNTMQISCLLGQIELEGKRPPKMICGRSLPSFPIDDFSPRAGGYIDARFMTGIQPQEFFFHCMAGREGLIDTAVKTSRSGYLQRCLIKHLEGLTVGYDLTVRDSDRSVVQFMYGEDGMDITKAQFLNEKQLRFLQENAAGLAAGDDVEHLRKESNVRGMIEHREVLDAWLARSNSNAFAKRSRAFTLFSQMLSTRVDNLSKPQKRNKSTGRTRRTESMLELWNKADVKLKNDFQNAAEACPMPMTTLFNPDAHFGAVNERLDALCASVDDEQLQDALHLKAMQSLAAPGDPVGLLAAQSIGEPSTQMTLNTFHFAGRGEMNVTLGIPRLREILMMASKHLKTPSMEVPFRNVPDMQHRAEKLVKRLTRVTIGDVLQRIDVSEQLQMTPTRQYVYILHFRFLPRRHIAHKYNVTPKKCIAFMQKQFFRMMFTEVKRRANVKKAMASADEEPTKRTKKTDEEEDDDDVGNTEENTNAEEGEESSGDSSEEEPDDVEDAKATARLAQRRDSQEKDEDEGEEDEELEKEKHVAAVRSHTVHTHKFASDYDFDAVSYEWCELTFMLPVGLKQIDMSGILRDVARQAVVWETKGIRRAITYTQSDRLMLRTDGVSFTAMFQHADLLQLDELYSNDVHAVARTYGVEAAARVLVREVRDVFGVYGIAVDARHLSLIADYMTFGGSYEPMSRKGMESGASPLQQMSFEASLTFLKQAVIKGRKDLLRNPSSCLMVGKPCSIGTGSFELLQNMEFYLRNHRSDVS